ncbi:cytochrome P450 [Frankia sp. CNm7]|uniref:Cytochrome P450 n=1 Tax=Frankia nepalensis TaxID=1836974 RepID=A0A937US42_9ACTN|nr:cytochrome P450 [Frankia nepalensis]MBL7500289.1 cytochrome P450 [Frankia nepalensis]MBL7511990.1 cytochrome P450 [Frankia nepalensis]MBL7522659.1 cytochrome P450 [Frankia nepalensis]MBL7631768.1 cytochrome P450 [Frankia nepalensis]
MTVTSTSDVYYDPYDVEAGADPFPVFRRLRDETPVYHNERYDFYALSRHTDVERALARHDTYISGRGVLLEQIRSDAPIPPGTVIFEDPPVHTIHRGLLARLFTPRKIAALEPQVRDYCVRVLDPLVGAGGFDFIKDLGLQLPMRVIGMLLGIPEQDQAEVRDRYGRHEMGKPVEFEDDFLAGAVFADYVDWRARNPSDDLMTELMTAEFTDERGVTRTLTRDELLAYINILAAAGNETTGRLIGWAGRTLADHPDQRRELVADPALVPNAIEEILRFQPPALQTCRYVAQDVEIHGRTVPAGSVMMLLLASANRDPRRYSAPDPDTFDIHRNVGQHLTFALGAHYCLGAALARLEGRVVLEEVLRRFPEWEVDETEARLVSTSTFRGWSRLPVRTP